MHSTQLKSAIRIGIVTTSYPLTEDSSSGIFVYRLLRHFPPDVGITVVTPASAKTNVRTKFQQGIEVVAFRYAPRSWQILAHGGGGIMAALSQSRWHYLLLPSMLTSMFFACLFRVRQIDVLHANWSINGVICGLVGKLAGKPVITTLRGRDVNLATRSGVHRMILRLCVRMSRKIVTVSDSLQNIVRDLNPDVAGEKFCTISNGIDDACFRIERKPAPIEQSVEIVTVASLVPRKGVDTILRALHALSDESLCLRVVGDGPEKGRLVALASSLGLQERVEFTGSVAPSQIARFLAAADMFVLASHSEGRPNALMEAMATALPVVATDIPGICEVVTERVNGLLFPVGDYSRLASRIKELAYSPVARFELGVAARKFVVDNNLRWTDTAARYYHVYQNVLANREPGLRG